MDTSLASLFNVYFLTTGRRMFALRQVQELAEAQGLDDLASHCAAAIVLDQRTRTLEGEWKSAGRSPRGNPEAQRVDILVDRTLTALRDTAEAQMAGVDDAELTKRGTRLLRSLFPEGLSAVTGAAFVEELAYVEGILMTLKSKENAPLVAELGLTKIAKRLAELQGEYRRAIGAPPPEMSFESVRAARAEGQERVLQALAMIVGRFPGASAEDQASRASLLEPIMRQNEAVRRVFKGRRGSVEDVNPLSGEPEAPVVAEGSEAAPG